MPKARALRDLTNIGITCLEELGDLNEVIGATGDGKQQDRKKSRRSGAKPEKPQSQPAKPEEKEKVNAGPVPMPSDKGYPNRKSHRIFLLASNRGNGNHASGGNKSEGNGKGKSKETQAPKISTAQKNAICNLSRRRGISMEQVEKMAVDTFGLALDYLTATDASSFIRQLQQAS